MGEAENEEITRWGAEGKSVGNGSKLCGGHGGVGVGSVVKQGGGDGGRKSCGVRDGGVGGGGVDGGGEES